MGRRALESKMQGLLGAWPVSWLWRACVGYTMEMVYILLAGILASAGPGAPAGAPVILCVVPVTREEQV